MANTPEAEEQEEQLEEQQLEEEIEEEIEVYVPPQCTKRVYHAKPNCPLKISGKMIIYHPLN